MRKKVTLVIGVILYMALLSGCGEFWDAPVGSGAYVNNKGAVVEKIGDYEITDRDRDTSENDSLEIDLENLEADREGRYTCDGKGLTIQAGGKYVLKGKLNNGSLTVNVFEDEIVHLILNNVEINSASSSAVYVEQADKVILTAKDGTLNVLSDGRKDEEAHRACVFSNSDLTINGGGSLQVYAYYTDGVRTKDQVKIVDTDLYVKAKEDGIRGNDGVILSGSVVEVECEGTGLFSSSEKDMVIVQGGSCKVIAGKNAVSANKYVSIRGSQTDLYSVWETIKCDGIRDIEEVTK